VFAAVLKLAMPSEEDTNLLIRRARVLLPEGKLEVRDVEVQQGKITQVSPEISSPAAQEVDAAGLTLLPGVIDPQVHFREPGLEHKEDLFTASCACAKGGVTSFLEMPNTRPLTTSQAALDDKLHWAAEKCLVNYDFFIGASADNLPDLRQANPTPGIKIFMGSVQGALLVDQEAALEAIFAEGSRLIAVHAEDQARIAERRQQFSGKTNPAVHSQIQDNQAALSATQLALRLSQKIPATAAHSPLINGRRSRVTAPEKTRLGDRGSYPPTSIAKYQRLRDARDAGTDESAVAVSP